VRKSLGKFYAAHWRRDGSALGAQARSPVPLSPRRAQVVESLKGSVVKEELMHVPMPEGVHLSPELPEWVKLSIADAVVVFGRMEQEIIEISWILMDADLKQRLKLARTPATENFIAVLESVERHEKGLQLDALKGTFRGLADERNLMVHGAWNMAEAKPWVVWHKFLEDDASVIGEFFEKSRFERFMVKGKHILAMLRRFHDMLEEQTGKKTTAVPR
jgi:hypothetical protein